MELDKNFGTIKRGGALRQTQFHLEMNIIATCEANENYSQNSFQLYCYGEMSNFIVLCET